jgi:hypothetical protein
MSVNFGIDPYKRTTVYEWDYETVMDNGDIVDHAHCDPADVVRRGTPDINDTWEEVYEGQKEVYHYELVLVRTVSSEAEGIVHRTWAYVEDGKLPEHFESGHKVPARFHWHIERAANASNLLYALTTPPRFVTKF